MPILRAAALLMLASMAAASASPTTVGHPGSKATAADLAVGRMARSTCYGSSAAPPPGRPLAQTSGSPAPPMAAGVSRPPSRCTPAPTSPTPLPWRCSGGAAWHAKVGCERRVFLAVSRDRGRSFPTPTELPAPPGPASYPALAVRDGGVQVAWQQGDAIVTQFIDGADPLLR
jgi:hypothetical protein